MGRHRGDVWPLLWGQELHRGVSPRDITPKGDSGSGDAWWISRCASILSFGVVVSWNFVEPREGMVKFVSAFSVRVE